MTARTNSSLRTYIKRAIHNDNKTNTIKKSCTRTCMIMIYFATYSFNARAGIIIQCTVAATEENTHLGFVVVYYTYQCSAYVCILIQYYVSGTSSICLQRRARTTFHTLVVNTKEFIIFFMF